MISLVYENSWLENIQLVSCYKRKKCFCQSDDIKRTISILKNHKARNKNIEMLHPILFIELQHVAGDKKLGFLLCISLF